MKQYTLEMKEEWVVEVMFTERLVSFKEIGQERIIVASQPKAKLRKELQKRLSNMKEPGCAV